MRRLVQSDKASKILSNPGKVIELRAAVKNERKSSKTITGRSGTIRVKRVGNH